MSRALRVAIFCVMVLAGFCTQRSALAQKKPTPPPAGTIYYNLNDEIWGMKADGAGKVRVLPGLTSYISLEGPTPSDAVQGADPIHDRWWVSPKATGTYDEYVSDSGVTSYNVPHYDLFAVCTNPTNRNQLVWVQLTDLYGILNLLSQSAYWSNDANIGSDSFAGGIAYDLRGVFTNQDGVTRVDLSGQPSRVRSLRLPLTASQIQTGWLAGNFEPFGPAAYSLEEFPYLVDQVIRPHWPTAVSDFSPTGQEIVISNQTHRLSGTHVFNPFLPPDWSNPLRTLWSGNGIPQWSPDGQTVVIASGGALWTVPASGAAAARVFLPISAKATSRVEYWRSQWSPDSQLLATHYIEYKNGSEVRQGLVRVNAAGAVTNLGADTTGRIRPIRWVSNVQAP